MKRKNRNNINEVGLVPDLAFMSPMLYLLIIVMGINLIPIEVRKKFIRNILTGSFIKNSQKKLNTKQKSAIESYAEFIVNDLSSNADVRTLLKRYKSLLDQKNDLDLEYKNSFIPKFKKEVKWFKNEPTLKDIEEFFSDTKNIEQFKILYKKHTDYKMDAENISLNIQTLMDRDFYRVIKKIISNQKYAAFDEILSALNNGATSSELKIIKKRYLKDILVKSKQFIQNQVYSTIQDDPDAESKKWPPEWLVDLLTFGTPNPSE